MGDWQCILFLGLDGKERALTISILPPPSIEYKGIILKKKMSVLSWLSTRCQIDHSNPKTLNHTRTWGTCLGRSIYTYIPRSLHMRVPTFSWPSDPGRGAECGGHPLHVARVDGPSDQSSARAGETDGLLIPGFARGRRPGLTVINTAHDHDRGGGGGRGRGYTT